MPYRITTGHRLNNAADDGQTVYCQWACKDVRTIPAYESEDLECTGCQRIAIKYEPAAGEPKLDDHAEYCGDRCECDDAAIEHDLAAIGEERRELGREIMERQS